MVDQFRGNPVTKIAHEATGGNTALREVVNLENEDALYTNGERPAAMPDVQSNDTAQIQYTSGTAGCITGALGCLQAACKMPLTN